MNRPVRDQWLRAAQSTSLTIAESNGKQGLKDKNRFFEIARGSALGENGVEAKTGSGLVFVAMAVWPD